MLLIDDDDRYARLRLIAWWDQAKLAAAKVMVVGAGALGNEVLKNLALVGVGTIHVVDFDDVERSNLTRSVLFRVSDCGQSKAVAAAAALEGINPDSKVFAYHANVITEIGLGLFRDVDVVIGCLDNREARLWVNRQCWKVDTPWVDGGIQEINGVVKVFVPPDSACYECGMTENDYRLINLRYSCPLLTQEDVQAGKVPTAPTIASIIGGMQSQEALKLIHGFPVEAGTALVFNGVANQFYRTAFQRQEACLSHDPYPDPLEFESLGADHPAAALLAALRRRQNLDGPLAIVLDRELVVSIQCADCGQTRTVLRPRVVVSQREAICESCGKPARPTMQHRIPCDSPLIDETLAKLGFAPYDIVRVETAAGEEFCLLAGDADERK